MNALFAAAVDIQTFCVARGWRSSVIGGLAVQRWGDPRQTRDVDLTLLTGLGGEEAFVESCNTTGPVLRTRVSSLSSDAFCWWKRAPAITLAPLGGAAT